MTERLAGKVEWEARCAHGVNYTASEEQVRAYAERKNAEDISTGCYPFTIWFREISEWTEAKMTVADNDATDEYVRQLEDAAHALWGELPAEQVKLLTEESPRLVEFLRHLHNKVGHEEAMTRRNYWSEA
jgi:hypothetical protein